MTSEPQTIRSGRIATAFAIVATLLVAAAKVAADAGLMGDVPGLLGSFASAALTHIVATLSLARTILGARRSAAVAEWLLRRVLGPRLAARIVSGPAVADLIVNACRELRARRHALPISTRAAAR
jgi:hypothetical protein